jgi:hypothetical protein
VTDDHKQRARRARQLRATFEALSRSPFVQQWQEWSRRSAENPLWQELRSSSSLLPRLSSPPPEWLQQWEQLRAAEAELQVEEEWAALPSETPSIEPPAEQLRAAEAELQVEEESAATATDVYRPAPEADIRVAIKDAYDAAQTSRTKAPNIKELPGAVLPLLQARGMTTSKAHIQKIGEQTEFKSRRGRIGVHRS